MRLRIALIVTAILLLESCLVHSSSISQDRQGAVSDSMAIPHYAVDASRGRLHAYREHSPGLTLHPDVIKGSRAHSTTEHDVVFLIKQRNMEELTRILHDVSDPRSKNYGNHLTSKEVIDLTSNPESHDETVAYLTAAGATVVLVEHAGGSITARAPISLWERMFDTEFHTYTLLLENGVGGAPFAFIRTEKYSVPIGLDEHVSHVLNTVQLPELKSSKAPPIRFPLNYTKSSRLGTDSVVLGGYLTPQSIINLYDIDDTTGHPQMIQAAYETVGQAYAPEDTASFQKFLGLPIRSVIASYGNKTVSPAWCKANGYTICAESNIDLQYMMGIADTPTIHWYTDKPMAWYLFALVHAPKPPPLVISMSYGSEEQYMSESEYSTFEESAKKLSVMGVSILVAAGDDGAAPHTARRNAAQCKYMPMFPTSCPYVISVGATQVFIVIDEFSSTFLTGMLSRHNLVFPDFFSRTPVKVYLKLFVSTTVVVESQVGAVCLLYIQRRIISNHM